LEDSSTGTSTDSAVAQQHSSSVEAGVGVDSFSSTSPQQQQGLTVSSSSMEDIFFNVHERLWGLGVESSIVTAPPFVLKHFPALHFVSVQIKETRVNKHVLQMTVGAGGGCAQKFGQIALNIILSLGNSVNTPEKICRQLE